MSENQIDTILIPVIAAATAIAITLTGFVVGWIITASQRREIDQLKDSVRKLKDI